MDISKIKQLIDLMEERTLAELTVQDGDKKVSLHAIYPKRIFNPSQQLQPPRQPLMLPL